MNTTNMQAKHSYRLVVLLTEEQKDALDRLVERDRQTTMIAINQSDIVRKLIVQAGREEEIQLSERS